METSFKKYTSTREKCKVKRKRERIKQLERLLQDGKPEADSERRLAHAMSLSVLALERVLLILEVVVDLLGKRCLCDGLEACDMPVKVLVLNRKQ